MSKHSLRHHPALMSAFMLLGSGLMQRLIGLFSTLVLARILLPEDFAVVAIATLVVMFVEVFTNTGSEQYVLSRAVASKALVNTAWTLDLLVKGAASAVILLLAYPISYFYSQGDLVLVVATLSISPIMTGAINPGLWRLKRAQRYQYVVLVQIVSKLIGVITTIAIAVLYKSYWALIIGQLATVGLAFCLSYVFCSYRPRLSLIHINKQLAFSSFMIGQELFGYVKANIDSFFVSKYYSNAVFGHFHIMKYISVIPSLNIMLPISEPLLVEMSKDQNNPEQQCFKYTLTFLMLSLVAIPISIFMFMCSKEIVLVVLGQSWVEYHSILGYMGLLVSSFFVATHCKRALMVLSKTNFVFAYEIFALVLVCIAVGINLDSSVIKLVQERVLIELAAAMLFFVCTTAYFLRQRSGYFVRRCLPVILMYTALGGSFYYINIWLNQYISQVVLALLCNALAFIALFIGIGFIAYKSYYKHTLEGARILAVFSKLVKKSAE